MVNQSLKNKKIIISAGAFWGLVGQLQKFVLLEVLMFIFAI